jgi:hypothetical protein
VAAVAGVAVWARTRLGSVTAVTFLVLASAEPVLLALSRQARGYGLTYLAAGIVTIAAVESVRSGRTRDLVLLGVGGAIGMLTLPVFSPMFGLTVLAVVLLRRDLLLRASAVTVGAAGLASLPYVLRLDDFLTEAGQRYGWQLDWHAPVTGWIEHLLLPGMRATVGADPQVDVAGPVTHGDLPPFALLVGILLIAAGVAACWQRGLLHIALITLLPVTGTYAVLTGSGAYVTGRFVSFLNIPLLVLVAMGLAAIVLPAAGGRANWVVTGESTDRWGRALGSVALLGVGVALAVGSAGLARTLITEPAEDTATVARIVDGLQADIVVASSARPAGLRFYFDGTLVLASASELQRYLCDPMTSVTFIEHPFANDPIDTSCLAQRQAARHEVTQRLRGGWIAVWHVPAEVTR